MYQRMAAMQMFTPASAWVNQRRPWRQHHRWDQLLGPLNCQAVSVRSCRCNVANTGNHSTRRTIRAAAAGRGGTPGPGLGDEDIDVAVFRFTLGIPGFDDRLIPRVVGLVGAGLLAVNHILSPAPEAQGRAEVVVLVLAAVCVLVPEIEERLKEALPGRGRQRMADNIEGAVNGFVLQPKLTDAVKQELAWSSVSLIKNTNSCGLLVVHEGQVVLARGAIGEGVLSGQDAAARLANMTQDLTTAASLPDLAPAMQPCSSADASIAATQQGVYLQDRAAMTRAQATKWASLPRGVQSVLVQALPQGITQNHKPSYMVLYSERPRALSDKERRWAAAIAAKLATSLA